MMLSKIRFSRGGKRALSTLPRDERGGIAVMFALALVPVAFLSLVSIDYARASSARQHLQEVLDAATLYAARSSATTADTIDSVGDKALTAQLASNLGIGGLTPVNGRLANASFTPSGTRIVGEATATVTPIIANLFIGGPMNIHANSEVVRSINRLEIAMVLDTTGSMSNNNKIDNLKTAAKNFIDKLAAAAATSSMTNPVRIAVVPFSTTVKVSAPVSLSSYNTSTFSGGVPTWLDGRARAFDWDKDIFTVANSNLASRIDRLAMLKQLNMSWGGCVEARKPPYDIQDTAPDSNTVGTLFTPFFWPDEPDTDSDYKNDYITDMDSNGSSSGNGTWSQLQGYSPKYTTSRIKQTGTFSQGNGYGADLTYGPNAGCAMQQLQRLSNNWTTLKSAIDGLVASGETNVPLGLMWGWHAVSPNAPLADGLAYGTPDTTKIIVLMTDGDNTMNDVSSGNSNNSWYHGYGYIWQNKLGTTSSDTAVRTQALDDRLTALCTNIKNQDIVIYSVGVGVSADAKALLTSCADTPTQYYDVTSNANNLDSAFSAIAGSIASLRISK